LEGCQERGLAGRLRLIGRLRRKIEYAKAQVRAKVEHPF